MKDGSLIVSLICMFVISMIVLVYTNKELDKIDERFANVEKEVETISENIAVVKRSELRVIQLEKSFLELHQDLILPDVVEVEVESKIREFTPEEELILVNLCYLEGGHQPLDQKCMIMKVVLNRLADGRFGESIEEVVFAPGQFTPADRIYSLKATDRGYFECWQALGMIESGWDEDHGEMYFWGDGKQNHFY